MSGAADKAGKNAQSATKKTPFGFMNVGDLAFDLPGSNVSKDDLPNNVKPSEAKGLPKGPTAKPPSGPSLPKVLQPCLLQVGVICAHHWESCKLHALLVAMLVAE